MYITIGNRFRVHSRVNVLGSLCWRLVVRMNGLPLEPEDADPEEVARAIVRVVDMEHGRRPFRVHIDPSQDGAELVNGVAGRIRRELLHRIDLEDVIVPE